MRNLGQQSGDDWLSAQTDMMRVTKTSTNDFVCAKRSLQQFAADKNGNPRATSSFLILVYDAHISINDRLLGVIKRLARTEQSELADQLSTFEVERGERWSNLVRPTALTLMMLLDQTRPDENGKVTRLVINEAQKQALLSWLDEHFPELLDGTPNENWSAPAKAADLYHTLLGLRKSSDQP
jgi:hypothetical protein